MGMYESFFGIKERPFASVPRVDQYFPAATIEATRQTLLRCIQRGEGAAMVVGPSGIGKTLLCHLLAEQLPRSLQSVLLTSGRLGSRRTLLQAILHGSGQPYRGMDEGELRLALVDYLTSAQNCPQGIALLVDEAHTLPLRLLDELRMLTNLVAAGHPRVRLVLVGGTTLEERFASPKLESFSQRLAARCYLEAFNRRETEDYIHTQLKRVQGDAAALFPSDTCHAVYRATDGVPRLVNQLCDHAMLLAYVGGKHRIEAATIEESWADLQQLPAPWAQQAKVAKTEGGVIEFGGLDDESEPSPAAPAPAAAAAPSEPALPAIPPSPSIDDLPPSPSIDVEMASPESLSHLDRLEAMVSEELSDDFQPAGSIKPEIELIFDDPSSPLSESFEQEEIIVDRYLAAIQRRRKQRSSAESPESEGRQADTVSLRRLPIREPIEEELAEVVVEDECDIEERAIAHRILPVHRQEYRQLFARLRRG